MSDDEIPDSSMPSAPKRTGGRFARRQRRENVRGGRHHRHVVRVTPEEEATLLLLAGDLHVSVPRLLVESALTHERGETVTERHDLLGELFHAVRLLAACSNNINQIARATNATGEEPPELAASLAAVRRAAERVEAGIDALIS